jgi:coenzyme F420-dependent glucose-6-phosphate dehydrogenase
VLERVAIYVEHGFRHLVFHAPGHDQRRFLDQFAADVLPRMRERWGTVDGPRLAVAQTP